MQNPEYSKRRFNSNYKILKSRQRKIVDEYGRKRYYVREIFCGNFHLTAQWIEPQWDLLLDRLKKLIIALALTVHNRVQSNLQLIIKSLQVFF